MSVLSRRGFGNGTLLSALAPGSDAATKQFEEAVKRQSHFADPYQYWGEALMKKDDYRGAIKKFEKAVKYAPKWGRTQINGARR